MTAAQQPECKMCMLKEDCPGMGWVPPCSHNPHTPAPDFSNPKIGDWIPGVGNITTEYERQFIA